MNPLRLSVVIATYNRAGALERLLGQLAAQSLPSHRFEVVVVDDGSIPPVAPAFSDKAFPFAFHAEAQPNAGAAAARHRGVLKSQGDILVILDDDMEVPPTFLEAHAALHEGPDRTVVLGRIRAHPHLGEQPLFERYNAITLDRVVARYGSGQGPRGNNLCTGNVSMRRADYLAVGGFDPLLERSEDAELGLRLEASGARFVFSEEAFSVHRSDHDKLSTFLGRAYRYGRYDLRIAEKHAHAAHADPFRYLFRLNPFARPLVGAALAAPKLARSAAKGLMTSALAADRAGLKAAAVRMTGIVYGMEYFRGIREERGSLARTLSALGQFLAKAHDSEEPVPRVASSLAKAVVDLGQDFAVRSQQEKKYGHPSEHPSFAVNLVQKVGLQISTSYRTMRLFQGAGFSLGAKVTSRLIRHLYGSDIHWEADVAPGVSFVHGMGLCISGDAKVGPGCILSQNVTLGMGRDPRTGKTGAPTLEANVHVGPGATLVGPITIGANSKIGPGAVVTCSIPAGCTVEAPEAAVRARKAAPAAQVAFPKR